MIDISRLYCGIAGSNDALRYGRATAPRRRAPVMVWNVTRRCNLACHHCYSASDGARASNELSTDEARTMIDQLAAYGCPVLILSGGEPLMRPDLIQLVAHATAAGLHVALSSNGTLLDDAMACRLKEAGVAYAGISLDGLGHTHDALRGSPGSFFTALDGIRAARRAGIKTGVRFTIMRSNADDIPGIFDLLEAEDIPRVCFYHLVYAGRGAALAKYDLDHALTRCVVDGIIARTAALQAHGTREVLTVDNHADGAYLYLRMQREGHPRAAETLELLRRVGGNGSGQTIGCISWDGTVYPDQFWRTNALGSMHERPFGEIWDDVTNPLMRDLKEKQRHVTGKCTRCRFLDICGGNMRARAEAATGMLWGVDPMCYLTETEIA